MTETSTYDNLNRLESIKLNNSIVSSIKYDAYGRMLYKEADGRKVFDATGQNCYQAAKPHALREAVMNVNPFNATQQQVTYTLFDKVKTIEQNGKRLDYTYGFDQQRVKAVETQNGAVTREKIYVGNCEFITDPDGSHRLTFLSGPMGVFAVAEEINGNTELHYVAKDHLGSWTAIADAYGNIEQEFSYDAWGNSRDPYTWTGTNATHCMFDRGFTGHEMLYDFGLINMNGRMYDPVMSSFFSVDRYVQNPENSQNFNRYAYCFNNPLKYTDPTGELTGIEEALIIGGAIIITDVTMNGVNNRIYNQPFFKGAGKIAITDAVQCALSFGIGEIANLISNEFGRMLFQMGAHAVLGGASSKVHGGTFWQGFATGGATSFLMGDVSTVTQGLDEGWRILAMTTAGGFTGGVTSVLAGGDFLRGVVTGAICAGLNHSLHSVCEALPEPDDPPGKTKQVKTRKENTENEAEAVAGNAITLIGGAAGQTVKTLNLDPKLSRLAKVSKWSNRIGIGEMTLNNLNNLNEARNGNISYTSFGIRMIVSGVEFFSTRIPYGGPIISIVITSIDVGGGFENNIYNVSDDWFYNLFNIDKPSSPQYHGATGSW